MYLLDSCVCIDIMKGKLPSAYEIMRHSDPKMFGVPAIVVAELNYGIEKSKRVRENRLLTERFLPPLTIIAFDEKCARVYGVIREQLQKEGRQIGPNDLLIAATAIANQATLVSNSHKEFRRIRGLEFESWYEIDAE